MIGARCMRRGIKFMRLTEKWLPAIIGAALLLRLGVAVYLGDTIEGEQQVRAFDQHSYQALAQALLGGRGYSFDTAWYPGFTPAHTPTAHWSFLYPLYLAGVYLLSGVHPLAARLVQALLAGGLATWLVYRLGKALFNPTVGVAAAGLSAFYLYFIFYDATLMTEPFFICAVLGLLLLGLQMSGLAQDAARPRDQAPALWEWALLGGLAGAAALLRQTILFWLPVQLAWMVWRLWREKVKGALPGALASLGVALLVILPWTVRNARVYHAFLPLNSNAGYALYSANHPDHGVRFDQDYAAPLPEDLLAKNLNEAQWNAELTRRGLEFMFQDAGRYARLTLNKATVFFNFGFSLESSLASNLMRVGSYGLYLPFFVLGLVLSWQERRRAAIIYLFALLFAGLHLLSWASARYRLPIDAALMPFAALALITLVNRLRRYLPARFKNNPC